MFNDKFYDKLQNNKIMLLIPGAIAVAISIALLIMAFITNSPEPAGHPALTEYNETITTEMIHTKEYLSQLSDVVNDVNDNWQTVSYDFASVMSKEIEDKINIITNNLGSLRTQIDNSNSDLTNLINRLEDLRIKDNEEAENELINIYNDLSIRIVHSLTEIHDYYTGTSNLMKNLFTELNKTNASDNEKLLETLKIMSEKMESNSSESLAKIVESVDNIELLVELNQEKLVNLLMTLGSDIDNSELKVILEMLGFDITKLSIESRDEILKIINELGSDNAYLMAKSHDELLKILDDFGYGTASIINSTKTDLTNTLLQFELKISGDINSIENKFINLDNKLDLLFQSVSSGKNILAAALLTDASVAERDVSGIPDTETGRAEYPFAHYAGIIRNSNKAVVDGKYLLSESFKNNSNLINFGTSVNAASGFEEFAKAAESAGCMQLCCVDGVPASRIEYLYHFHTTDGETGATVENDNADNLTLDVSGGCYTKYNQHIHEQNSICYSIASCRVYESHISTNNGETNRCTATLTHSGCGIGTQNIEHRGFCPGGLISWPASPGARNGGWREYFHEYLGSLKCEVPTTPYYSLDCGKMRGQILSVTITYF